VSGLWRHREFLKLWTGQSVSAFGTQVTQLALPLAAALTLHASAFEMGLLTAASMAAFIFLSLPAGVWTDRRRRLKRVALTADLGRGLLLASVPAAAILGRLTLLQLILVALGTGCLDVFFRLAYWSYIPRLVAREHLTAANSRLMTSESLARLAGPGVAGVLVQVVTAPVAIAADALSYAVSAAAFVAIRTPEPEFERPLRQSALSEIREGFKVVRNPVQRAIIGSATTVNFFGMGVFAIQVLYAVHELRLSPSLLGAAISIASAGALLGALAAPRAARRFGQGRAIVLSALLFPISLALMPLAAGPPLLAAFVLAAAQFVGGVGVMIFDVNSAALRQQVTPPHLMGRTTAVMQFVTQGAKPLGSLLGGVLGQLIGLRPTLWVMAVGGLAILPWVVTSPLIRRGAPEPR
jgi:MFS family permease